MLILSESRKHSLQNEVPFEFLSFKGRRMYRSTCLVETGVIYLFAPGIWTEFKMFSKVKRLSLAAGCERCDQGEPSA